MKFVCKVTVNLLKMGKFHVYKDHEIFAFSDFNKKGVLTKLMMIRFYHIPVLYQIYLFSILYRL